MGEEEEEEEEEGGPAYRLQRGQQLLEAVQPLQQQPLLLDVVVGQVQGRVQQVHHVLHVPQLQGMLPAGPACCKTDRQTDRQTDRHTDTQTDRDRQRDRAFLCTRRIELVS